MERPARSTARPHLVLVGMMGAGKSSVARHVARKLGWSAVDLDADIERAAGCTITTLFARDGEAAFRRRESAALHAALAPDDPAVVAAGGGIVVRAENRAELRERATVVWLRALPSTLLRRVGAGHGRPLLVGDPIGNLERIAGERAALYADVADEVVDVDELELADVVERVAKLAR